MMAGVMVGGGDGVFGGWICLVGFGGNSFATLGHASLKMVES